MKGKGIEIKSEKSFIDSRLNEMTLNVETMVEALKFSHTIIHEYKSARPTEEDSIEKLSVERINTAIKSLIFRREDELLQPRLHEGILF